MSDWDGERISVCGWDIKNESEIIVKNKKDAKSVRQIKMKVVQKWEKQRKYVLIQFNWLGCRIRMTF